ncbi:ribonuclease HII [Methylobacillus sp. MM3]|jgi:ribonuclease HII|uniref:ribonuclease HII n=1 Tax=Methylobacillus sp. MM3 TaxID=1848039 RepID=UPI0007DF40D2|nr:ribonuclease HII [Methylobacillus sp. MM3]OAJ71617.1 ribonuclease HII [Methylobacillus sp. MM3]
MKQQLLHICGVDEAGRGPLAGPVYAAAVILDPAKPIDGIADSKTLTEKKRDVLAAAIKLNAIAWCVAFATVEEIDRINILQATLLAMKRAVEGLSHAPHQVLVDGLQCPSIAYPATAVVNGDSTVLSIGAASILAKTARDAEMCRLDLEHPQYGFSRHKGYSTAEHLALLELHGVSPVHRKSYAPVKRLLTD